jgi:hypothetical protein
MDEFAKYAVQESQRVLISGDDYTFRNIGRIRIYGCFSPEMTFIGLSFSSNRCWAELDLASNEEILKILTLMSAKTNAPLIWVGEKNIDWSSGTGIAEVGIIESSGGGLSCIAQDIKLGDVTNWVRKTFGVGVAEVGSRKQYTDKPIDGFQSWFQHNLPRNYVANDVDLLVLDIAEKPQAIVEIKRSKVYAIEDWYPFVDDKPNYLLLKEFANRCQIRPYIVNQKIRDEINDDDLVVLYDLTKSFECKVRKQGTSQVLEDKEISYSRQILKALEAMKIILS